VICPSEYVVYGGTSAQKPIKLNKRDIKVKHLTLYLECYSSKKVKIPYTVGQNPVLYGVKSGFHIWCFISLTDGDICAGLELSSDVFS
jgi:hypothetical protein